MSKDSPPTLTLGGRMPTNSGVACLPKDSSIEALSPEPPLPWGVSAGAGIARECEKREVEIQAVSRPVASLQMKPCCRLVSLSCLLSVSHKQHSVLSPATNMRFLPTILGLLAWNVAAEKHVKVFDLTLTWEAHAPNGQEREMILVNGQFPGPALELSEGDHVEVNVHNKLPFDTSVHFHGMPP